MPHWSDSAFLRFEIALDSAHALLRGGHLDAGTERLDALCGAILGSAEVEAPSFDIPLRPMPPAGQPVRANGWYIGDAQGYGHPLYRFTLLAALVPEYAQIGGPGLTRTARERVLHRLAGRTVRPPNVPWVVVQRVSAFASLIVRAPGRRAGVLTHVLLDATAHLNAAYPASQLFHTRGIARVVVAACVDLGLDPEGLPASYTRISGHSA